MDKKKFFEFIVPKVELYLTELGFAYKKSKGEFVKEIEDGWIKVGFFFYQFGLTDNVNVGFTVRKNSVEELFVKYIEVNPSNHKSIPTITFALTSLYKHSENSFRFTNETELDTIIELKILPFLENRLPAMVKSYSELKNIYRLYADSSEENNFMIVKSYDNYIRALIIGRLLLPDDFENVAAWCNRKLLQMKLERPHSLDTELYDRDFIQIVTDLKSLKL